MAPDELKIILEDVKEKFDLVIKAVSMTNERLDRNEKATEERFAKLDTEIPLINKDIQELRRDLNDHRSNTELRGPKKSKKVS